MAAFALLLLTLAWTPGQGEDDIAARLAEHERTVRAERTLAFFEAWLASGEDARSRARGVLEAARPRGGPAVAPPSLAALVDAWRELRGGGFKGPLPAHLAGDQRGLQSLADSIDLTLAPGAFEAREGAERGDPLVVFVRTLFRPRSWADVELALIWVAPSGEEVLARREPVETPLFVDGFPMYVRSPPSAPGTWRLVPEVTRDGRSARGAGAAVECVAELALRAERALGGEADGAAHEHLRALLGALLERGDRRALALGPAGLLGALEGAGGTGLPRPVEVAFVDRDGVRRWLWALRLEKGDPQRAILLLAPHGERADLMLAGTVGARWRDLAREQRALLLSTELPASTADRTVAQLFLRLAQVAREGGVPSSGELLLVARGDAALRSTLLPAERFPFDAAVLSTVLREPESVLPGLPRLVLTPGGPQALPAERGELAVLAGERETILNDPGLPARVAAWMAWR